MSGWRTYAAGLVLCAAMVPGPGPAQPAPRRADRVATDVDATSAVTLDRLSVKMLGVDRPWNPHICIGCEVNNAAPSLRAGRDRHR